MTFLLTCISLYPRILLGFLITNFFWKTTQTKHFLIKFFLIILIGFGFSSLVSFLWMWLSLPLEIYVYIEILLAIVVSIYLIARYYKKINTKMIYVFVRESKEKLWLFLGVISFLGFATTLTFTGLENPHGGFDAWYNWNIVARFIYRGGSEWQATFLRTLSNPDYPLFVPISIALSWFYIQKETIFAPLVFHFILSLFAVGLLFAFIYAFKGIKQATLAVILFIAQPISISGMSQYADFPLSYIILAVGGLTLLYFQAQEKQLALLVGFLTGLAAWTKNEGFIIIISSTMVWIYIGWFYNRLALQNYILGLIFPLGIVILFKIFLAPSNGIISSWQTMLDRILDLDRFILISQKFITTLWSVGGEYMIILIGIYAVLVGGTNKQNGGLKIIFGMILFQLFAYFAIYLVTPYNVEWHLKTSLSRLYLHVYPLFLLLFFMWLKSPDELIKKETI